METMKLSPKGPSHCQAPAYEDPSRNPDGISLGKVLCDSGDSFKRFMGSHVDAVIKKMRESKIISKHLYKAIRGQHNTLDLLLAEMKRMPPDKFILYLELLLSIAKGKEEKHDDGKTKEEEKKAEDCANQRSFNDDTKELMRIMIGSLEAMTPEPDSRLGTAISNIVLFVQDEGKFLSQTTAQEGKIQVDHSPPPAPLSASPPPPPGQLGDAVSATFTNEGGILYSPLHGVTVIIPPNAIPGKCSYVPHYV